MAQDDRSSVLNGEQLASYIDSRQSVPNEICLVAKLGHEVIGVCNVTSNQDTKTSHIGDIFIAVAKPYWGNGEGTKKRGARTKNGEFLDVYLMAKLID